MTDQKLRDCLVHTIDALHKMSYDRAVDPIIDDISAALAAPSNELSGISGELDLITSQKMRTTLSSTRSAVESESVKCACGDEFPLRSYGHGFMDAARRCPNCDATCTQNGKYDARPAAHVNEIGNMEQVELTDAEIGKMIDQLPDWTGFVAPYFAFARAVIAAHEAKKAGCVR